MKTITFIEGKNERTHRRAHTHKKKRKKPTNKGKDSCYKKGLQLYKTVPKALRKSKEFPPQSLYCHFTRSHPAVK